MALDLSSLRKAVDSLEGSINSCVSNQKNKSLSEKDKETLRSGVIQNFEVAYELCWKFMKRWLEEQVSPYIADGVVRRELYRISAEHRLIADVECWMNYHEVRNLTSHTYDAGNAEKAFKAALEFIHDAKDFLKTLEGKND